MYCNNKNLKMHGYKLIYSWVFKILDKFSKEKEKGKLILIQDYICN